MTEVIDVDWPDSEKLQLMKGIKPQNLDKIVLNHHIENIQTLCMSKGNNQDFEVCL